ncbi:hypothetical protein Lal_00027049 [Lupinus albus]|nr:hypothetical protein Lal_00027049 [Lupinus albus]
MLGSPNLFVQGLILASITSSKVLREAINLLHNRDKLWVHMLLAKYSLNLNILPSKKKYGSQTWNTIQKAMNKLQDEYKLIVGESKISL